MFRLTKSGVELFDLLPASTRSEHYSSNGVSSRDIEEPPHHGARDFRKDLTCDSLLYCALPL